MTNYKIDDLDQKIIQLLSTDARLSNRKIATQLGFTEGTIRSRVKRLEDENFIRFTAVTNMSMVWPIFYVLSGPGVLKYATVSYDASDH